MSASLNDRRQLLPFALLLVGAVPLLAQNGTLPSTLREHGRQLGCSEVAGFYDHPGRIDPPYVWGYLDSTLDASGDRSAVYWCERTAGPERYLLVVWLSDTSLAAAQRCPPTIAWRNHPYGLHLLRNERLRLGDFWYRANPREHGPADQVTKGPVIESNSYDGVAARFYCYAGKWLVQQLH